MPRKVAPLLPATEELVRQLGDRLRLARLRRGLSAKQVAVRAGMAPMTLRSLERGGSAVTIGAYLAVMQVLGIETDLDLLAQADPAGRALQDARLSARRKTTTAVTQRPPVLNSRQHSPTSVRDEDTPLLRRIENAPPEQLPKLFESLPTEQMRKALEALPQTQIRGILSALPGEQLREMANASARAVDQLSQPAKDAQNWIERSRFLIENAHQEQLQKLFESLPTEQMRKALEALPQTQIRGILSALPGEQLREMANASARAVDQLRKPAEDIQDWIERSGFSSSRALADLIDAPQPQSKRR